MLRRNSSPRDWLFFAVIALLPALAMGWLANSALRGEEAAVGREMQGLIEGEAQRLRAEADAAELVGALPYAEGVVTGAEPEDHPPQPAPCAEYETKLLHTRVAKLDATTRTDITQRCFRLLTPAGRFAWPLVALAPGANTPEALIKAWIEDVADELPPAERAATRLDLEAASWLGDARPTLVKALDASAGHGSLEPLLAPHRGAMRAERREIRWSDARSKGVLRRRADGRYEGAIVHPPSIARALAAGWPSLPEGVEAQLLVPTSPPGPTDVPLLEGGALVRLGWSAPDAVASRTARAQRLLVAASTGAVALALALAAWLFARMRRERRLSALRTDFVAAVSHELRTPIASMRMLSELLAEDRVEEEDRAEVTAGLAQEAKRLGDTVNRLLRFSRMEAGHSDGAARRETDVAALLSEVAARFRTRHPDHEVEEDWPEALTFAIDAEAVGMALDNLLGNARKYAPEGAPYRLGAAIQDGTLRISVQDHGPGIARRDQQRIFRAFERAADRLSEATEGSGIGLSLVQHVARSHGGHVALESAPGRGATFTLVLPPG